ncbi:MAG: thioredoxin family protein [Eubacteriales bacterium]|nr:thioredoxin family protein [Eubacteriales bacterium]
MLSLWKKRNRESQGKTETESLLQEENPVKHEIVILGIGCAKCNEMENNTKKAVAELNMNEEVKHITDLVEIVGHGVTSIPALVIDGKVLSVGDVISVAKIKELIQERRNMT